MDYKLYEHKVRARSFIWFYVEKPLLIAWSSVTKISKLILLRGFQLVGHLKTKKTSEYSRIIILDQKSHPIFF